MGHRGEIPQTRALCVLTLLPDRGERLLRRRRIADWAYLSLAAALPLLASLLLSTSLALLSQNPLRRHQILLLAFPVAALAGVGARAAVDGIGRPRGNSRRLVLAGSLATLLLIPVELASNVRVGPSLLNRFTFDEREMKAGREAVAFLQAYTPPGSTIITDDPMLAFLADRHIPPQLAVPSARRLESGNLGTAELIALSEGAHPSAVLLWQERLRKVPAYLRWVLGRYCLVRAYPDSRYIYLPFDPEMIPYPQRARVGDSIAFLGSQLARFPIEAGAQIPVTLYWQARAEMGTSYTVFTHLLNGRGEIVAQWDQIPGGGRYPTTGWLPGEVIVGRYRISLPEGPPAGAYQLTAGMYYLRTGRRLVAFAPDGRRLWEDHIPLGEIEVRGE